MKQSLKYLTKFPSIIIIIITNILTMLYQIVVNA